MSRQAWRWFDFGLLPVAAALVRLCWVWPWLELLRRWLAASENQPYLPLWTIFGLSVAGAAVTYVALDRAANLRRARLWVVGIGLAAILGLLRLRYGADYALWDIRWFAYLGQRLTEWEIGIPPAFVTLIAAGWLWLRGVRDGRAALTNEEVWRAFSTGFLALVLLLIVGRIDPSGPPPAVDRWIVALFAFGMAALALTSLELSQISGRNETRNRLRLDRYWLGSAGVVILGLLLLGLLVTALVTPSALASLFGWLPVALSWIALALTYVMLAFAYVLFWLLRPLIEWLMARASERAPDQEEQGGEFGSQFDEFTQGELFEVPPALVESAQWIGLIVVLVVIGVAIALALRYLRMQAEDDVEETRETIFSADLLQAQLAALWRKLMARGGLSAEGQRSPYLSLEDEREARREVRAIYQELLDLAKAHGHGREPVQTPLEYLAMLAAAYPVAGEALATLTEHYVAVRYSEETLPSAVVERVRAAWARLRAEIDDRSEDA